MMGTNDAELGAIKLAKAILENKRINLFYAITQLLDEFRDQTGLQPIVEHLEIPGYGDQGNRHTIKIRVEI